MDGEITEFPMPSAAGSPINIAVGPDRNIWFTKAGKLGRVTPDGAITEFAVPGGGGRPASPPAATARPPDRLVDKLWFAESAGNKIAYLELSGNHTTNATTRTRSAERRTVADSCPKIFFFVAIFVSSSVASVLDRRL